MAQLLSHACTMLDWTRRYAQSLASVGVCSLRNSDARCIIFGVVRYVFSFDGSCLC